jgi:hypothetical protein
MDIKHIKPNLEIDPHSFKPCSIMKINEIKKVMAEKMRYIDLKNVNKICTQWK